MHLKFDPTFLEIKFHRDQLRVSVIHTGKGTIHWERDVAVIVKISAKEVLLVKIVEIKFRLSTMVYP